MAGKRVRERWKGVEEFGFVEVGDGTKATMEEIEDLKEAKQKVQAKKAEEEAEAAKAGTEKASDGLTKTQEGLDDLKIGEKASEKKSEESGEMSEAQAAKEVEADQLKLQEKLLQLSAQAGNRTSISLDSSRSSIDSPRPSLDHPAEEKDLTAAKKPPSLTVRQQSLPSHVANTLTTGNHCGTRFIDCVQDRSHYSMAGNLFV